MLLSCFPYIYPFIQWHPEQNLVGALMVYSETIFNLAIILSIAGLVYTQKQNVKGILSTSGIRKNYYKEPQLGGYETND